MTTEELLKPRYKVIADYPSSTFNVGQILLQDDKDDTDFWTGDQLYTDRYPKLYPHLFRKLEWWEERKVEDMPEYIKVVTATTSLFMGNIYKILKYGDGSRKHEIQVYRNETTYPDPMYWFKLSNFIPATEQDYNNQKP